MLLSCEGMTVRGISLDETIDVDPIIPTLVAPSFTTKPSKHYIHLHVNVLASPLGGLHSRGTSCDEARL